jgi:hypothetical protein
MAGPDGPVIIAGPTCDSADTLYEHTNVRMPLALRAGDRVRDSCDGRLCDDVCHDWV